jgi:hypothetical protein
VKHLSIFTWFRPEHSLYMEHVTRRQESCFTGELLYRCLLLASTKKMFFATSSIRIASLEEKRDQNERICNGKQSIFSNGWAK